MVEAANSAAGALRKALKVACRLDGASADIAVEAFFAETEMDFEASVHRVIKGADEEVEEAWHKKLRGQAIRMFDERVLDGLTDHDISGMERRVTAKRKLLATLAKQVREKMDLPMPDRKENRA